MMKLVWFSRKDGSLAADSRAGAYYICYDVEEDVYVLSHGEYALFESPSLEEAKSWAEEFAGAFLAARRRMREALGIRPGFPQRRPRLYRPNDEALTDQALDYDPMTDAVLESYGRRLDEARVEEETTD